jgi:hypothetical protein
VKHADDRAAFARKVAQQRENLVRDAHVEMTRRFVE